LIFIVKIFIYLIIYSFIGWLYESTLCSISAKKIINRGFLNGPICPIYGFGAIAVILVFYQRVENIGILFLGSMLLTSVVEYITSFLLEKIFHTKWWDYSNRHFNIKGRIFLLGAVVFGAFSVLAIKFIHPLIERIVNLIPEWVLVSSSILILVILLIDLYITTRYLFKLNNRLEEIQIAFNYYKEQYLKRTKEFKGAVFEKFEKSEFYNERIEKLLNWMPKQGKRLARAFPGLRPQKVNGIWQKLKTRLLSNNKNGKKKTKGCSDVYRVEE